MKAYLPVALALGFVAACGPKSASAPGPSQTTATRITPEQCESLATAQTTHCGYDHKENLDSCQTLARVAEAGSCVPQAQRAFECETKRIDPCNAKECCAAKSGACDETNTDFDHCVRGYCGGHAENPDCKWVLETWK